MQEKLKSLKEVNRNLRREIRQRSGESLNDLSFEQLPLLEEDIDNALSIILEEANVFMELASARKHYNRKLSITKNCELMSFLENTATSLSEGDLPLSGVLNPLDLDLSSSHD
ncbi:hypothetical protein Patl1_35945 [Pistacia atlantica]|nr:hypothetical protein Patl1_35945 [Pistacia atlantica]